MPQGREFDQFPTLLFVHLHHNFRRHLVDFANRRDPLSDLLGHVHAARILDERAVERLHDFERLLERDHDVTYIRYYSRALDRPTARLRGTNPLNELAERAGFEPADTFQRRALSKRVPSATRPPLP